MGGGVRLRACQKSVAGSEALIENAKTCFPESVLVIIDRTHEHC
jgi:hypothetical protein